MQAADLIQSIYSNVPILISYYAEIMKFCYAFSGEKKIVEICKCIPHNIFKKM